MKRVLVAFDVDGTLRCNHTDTCEDPNERMIELLKTMHHMKNVKVIVWTGTTPEYAYRFVRKFGLEKYVPESRCYSKISAPELGVDIAIDDIQECELGKVNLIVREK